MPAPPWSAASGGRKPAKNFPEGNFIIVDDTLEGLVNLAASARARSIARVIGITGSVGKTSTKEFLATILSDQGKCHANKKALTIIGVCR